MEYSRLPVTEKAREVEEVIPRVERSSAFLRLSGSPTITLLLLALIGFLIIHGAPGGHVLLNSLTTTCPSPDQPRVVRQHTGNRLILPSQNSSWEITQWQDSGACNSFSLRVKRTDAQACQSAINSREPSADPAFSAQLKQRGPDALWLRTDGAERFSSETPVYEGDCSYRFDIALQNGGATLLSLWHMYEDYKVFDDQNLTWPDLLLTPLLSNSTMLPPCRSECQPTMAPLLLESAAQHSSIPTCSQKEPVEGAYLPLHMSDIITPPIPVSLGADNMPTANRYRFVPQGCEYKHAGLRFGAPETCASKKQHVLFLGDSHTRVLFSATLRRLKGIKTIIDWSDGHFLIEEAVDQTSLTFRWDPLGEAIASEYTCETIANATAIVLGLTHHFASHPKTSAEASEELNAAISQIARLDEECPLQNGQARSLIFFTGVAQPPRLDEWPKHFGDHRTNARLALWRDISSAHAMQLGYSVIDGFALTHPFAFEPIWRDSAHYLSTDAVDPQVDEFIQKASLCSLADQQN